MTGRRDLNYFSDSDFTQENLKLINGLLHRGDVILYPTDTIWGLGCDAHNERAINKIFKIKNRPKSKPLLLLVNSIEMLHHYVKGFHPRVETLLTYHTQPLTLIHKAGEDVPSFLQAKEGTIAIRVTKDPFCKAVIKNLGNALTSTSANIAGDDFPKMYTEVNPSIRDMADYVVKYRQEETKEGKPSVIANYDSKGQLNFLRS